MAHKFTLGNAKLLDSPERLAQEDPSILINASGLQAGMAVGDIGCGPGYYTIALAKMVGPSGKVFAVDIQQGMLNMLAAKIGEAGLKNIELIKSQENSIPLSGAALDMAFLVKTLHEAESKELLLGEINRIMRSGGKLILADWVKAATAEGPPIAERIDEGDAEKLLIRSGFGNFQKTSLSTDWYGIKAEKL